MGEQRLLDLGPGDVVPGGHDHVIAARLEPEVAVLVHHVGVSGDVPAIAYVLPLPVVGEVAAAGRALDGEPAHRARRHGVAVLVEHRGDVTRNGATGRARPYVVVGGGDEDVQHLGGCDPIDEVDNR